MISRDDVIDGYREILGREPENDLVIDHHRHFETRTDLFAALLQSDEFRGGFRTRFTSEKAITLDMLDEVALDFEKGNHDRWRGHSLSLPDWFDPTLDPWGAAYRDQMLKLWEAITNRSGYQPASNEDTPEIADLDATFRPAFYASGDTRFAGGQLMAMGHILMRSDIAAGQRVLEYGAGFGLTALSFGRLGAKVDTVDINPAFCRAVQTAADRYQVDLTPHVGEFGFNPAGIPNAYDLIFFYESFHHALDFAPLLPRLRDLLTPTGKVILAGEPIFDALCSDLPYLWGFRLDWENVAVMRIRGWLELGFQKNFLIGEFARAGFECTEHRDPNSHWAQVYEFRQRG
ncbi:SAM-dependent methyltransferase [Rhizorhabdus wittichii DC-6]|nr:SAM-dependent methyltransferase [Rhizorhabdus wittichii DC-6]